MAVITISRDFGSEGDNIAEKTAQALNYHFVDKEFFSVVLSKYGMIEFDREYDALPNFWEKFGNSRDDVMDMLNRVVRAVAQHGNVVILGRSGFEVLKEFADIVHVRLQAPIPVRITRVMSELKLPFEQAEKFVNENDKVHMAFVQEYYKMSWDAIHAFDLVVNTGKISPDLTTSWLVDAVKALRVIPDPRKPLASSIEVDNILKTIVSDALECKSIHN